MGWVGLGWVGFGCRVVEVFVGVGTMEKKLILGFDLGEVEIVRGVK